MVEINLCVTKVYLTLNAKWMRFNLNQGTQFNILISLSSKRNDTIKITEFSDCTEIPAPLGRP